jgi:hypothetical protein
VSGPFDEYDLAMGERSESVADEAGSARRRPYNPPLFRRLDVDMSEDGLRIGPEIIVQLTGHAS